MELGLKCVLPGLKIGFRWSSTLEMTRKLFVARRLFTVLMSGKKSLEDMLVSEVECKLLAEIATFLKSATNVTEHQSASSYVTMIVSSQISGKLDDFCNNYTEEEEEVFKQIAQSMLRKLQKYRSLFDIKVTRFVRILNLRFRKDFITDENILRSFLTLQKEGSVEAIDCEKSMLAVMNDILDENSLDMFGDEEIMDYLKDTEN